MAEDANLSGTVNGGPVGNGPSENEEIPSNQVDYLKVRAYLYKFTPEIFFAGSRGQQDFEQTSLDTSTAADYINQAEALKPLLTGLIRDLQAVDLEKVQDYGDFLLEQSVIKARGSLAAFKELPTLAADQKLIIFDEARNNDLSGRVGAVKSIDMPSKTYNGMIGMYNTFAAKLPTLASFDGIKSELKASRRDLLVFLGTAIQTINSVVKSQQGAQSKLQQDLTKITNNIKQFQVSRFVYDLNTKDLSRFDISKYLSQYQINQQLGMLCPGGINASALLQDAIVPLIDLSPIPGPRAVRRPIFFPDKNGDYAGYENGIPKTNLGASSLLKAATSDPISGESVSDIEADTLLNRIAMAQTMEDNGGGETFKGSSAFERDVLRVEIAMRLRGIQDARKKELIVSFFRTGIVDDELIKRAAVIKSPKGYSRSVATAQLAAGNVTPLGLSSGLNAAERKIVKEFAGVMPGNLKAQLDLLKSFLTDPKVDGIVLSDLVQKYDFLSIFVYKHEISPDVVEETLEGATTDSYFFDKESLFMYTPSAYLLNQEDVSNRHFATYSPEFNGFVLTASNASAAGAVNSLTLNMIGSLGLLGATKRIYNGTIFQDSVFDAAELADDRLFNLYQNLYQDKDPFQILTTLLESIYLLRVTIPEKDVKLSDERKDEIGRAIRAGVANAPGAVLTEDRIQTIIENKIKLEEAVNKSRRTQGGKSDYVRDGDGNTSSFLDILSLRAFNQFGETKRGVVKGPKHLFNMASYLYSNVMRSRRFNVRVASAAQVNSLDVNSGGRAASGKLPFDLNKQPDGFTVNGAFDPYSSSKKGINLFLHDKESDGSGGSILEINPSISAPSTLKINRNAANQIVTEKGERAWKAYFIFLSQSFGDFVADLKNGLEIMNDVINSCYLELYETPGGRFIYRTPQYNNNIPIYRTNSQDGLVKRKDEGQLVTDTNADTSYKSTDYEASSFAHMITSEDIIPISAEYSQTAKDLVTKQQMGYGADLIGVPIPQLYYFYSNGKAVSQYGLTMSQAVVNPNVRFIPKEKLESLGVNITDSTYAQGIFHYCRFFLEYNNLNNFEGVVSAIGDPKIQVGRTYFDIKNQKFGYITEVSKHMEVGGDYVVTFTLKAVRDAVYDEIISDSGSPDGQEAIGRPSFRKLPEMESFIPRFVNETSKIVKTLPSIQKQKAPPSETTLPITPAPLQPRFVPNTPPKAPLFIPARLPVPVGLPVGLPRLPGFIR